MLKRHDIPFVAVDGSPQLVAKAREEGVEIYWGDAARPEFLARVGLAHEAAAVGQRGEEGPEPEGDLAGQGGIGMLAAANLLRWGWSRAPASLADAYLSRRLVIWRVLWILLVVALLSVAVSSG